MKRVLTILLLFVTLFSTTDFKQLMKIPVLITHFNDFQKTNDQSSFWDFIVLHYNGHHLNHHPNNDDLEQDKELPFIVYNDVIFTVFVVPKSEIVINRVLSFHKNPDIKNPYSDSFLSSTHIALIWRPPRV